MMDDKSNISTLRAINGELSWSSIKEYIGLSKSGVLKRPISMFSFLIDGNSWPTNPWSFKRTNLFIHLINGVLLFTLYFKIFHQSERLNKDAFFIASFSMALWLFHPFLISSVLYIVQRMAMLVATFVLLGLLLYTVGRIRYKKTSGKKGLFCMLLGMYILPIFAVLSKENGILLVYFIVLFEVFIFQRFLNYKSIKRKITYWLYLPPLLTTIGLLAKLPSFLNSYYFREFSVYERILTQFRAITAYLYNIFLPRFITEGAYTDGYVLSHGLFEPVTTILSVLFIIVMFLFAWIIRKDKPLISFSILFFFVAHLLESTIIPLELYYEHRNYVPMLFIFLPVVLLFNKYRKKTYILYYPIYIIIAMFLFMTFLKASLWGDNFKLHQVTMNKYPSSTRAITMVAVLYEEKRDLLSSYNTLKKGMEINNSFEIKINYLNILCSTKSLREQHLAALYKDSKVVKMTRTGLPPFRVLLVNLLSENCGLGEPIKNSEILLKIIKENSFESSLNKKPILYMLRAQIEFRLNRFNSAVKLFTKSFNWEHNFDNIFLVTTDLMSKNKKKLALEVLNIGWAAYQEDYKYTIDLLNYEEAFYDIRRSIEEL